MLHATLSTLVRYASADLGFSRRRRVSGHVIRCRRCRARLARIEGVRAAANELLSPDAPYRIDTVLARIRSGDSVLLPVAVPARGRGIRRSVRFAVAFLAMAGAASAAIAYEPVRSWLVDRLRPADEAGAQVTGVEVPVPPGGLDVRLVDPGPDLRLRITVDDGSMARVTGAGGAAAGTFALGDRDMAVRGAATGTLHIMLPRGAGAVRILADTFVIARMDGGRIRLAGDRLVADVDEVIRDLVPAIVLRDLR